MKILCIGHSSYDITLPLPKYPEENTKYRISNKIECGGGPAGNAAYLLGKWGEEVYIASAVGTDEFGFKIKNEYKSVNVNTKYLEADKTASTSLSFILINEENGSRTLFNTAVKYPKMKSKSILLKPDVILVDGHNYDLSMKTIKENKDAISIIDAGRITPELLKLCEKIKYIVCSKGFAENVTGIKFNYEDKSNLEQVYKALQERFPRSIIIITLEEKGALYQDKTGINIYPAMDVVPVDTTGAGDIFHGAFTYAIANNYPVEDAIRFANITSGLSVTKMGSRLSIPSLKEVEKYVKKSKR